MYELHMQCRGLNLTGSTLWSKPCHQVPDTIRCLSGDYSQTFGLLGVGTAGVRQEKVVSFS